MSAETIPAEVLYLIRKGGLFYRPNSQGYTAHTFDAGRYTLAEAEAITHPNGPDGPRDGLSYVPAPADRSTRPAEPAAPVAEAGDGDVAASLAHLNIGYLYGIADALEHTDSTRAGDIRQCLLQVVKGLSAFAATLEAERARADELRRLLTASGRCVDDLTARFADAERDRDVNREAATEYYERMEAAEQRAADALARAEKAEGEIVETRDLLWRIKDFGGRWTAKTPFGSYFIDASEEPCEWAFGSGDYKPVGSLEDAKAAAQADFKARARSCLLPSRASREAQPATDGGEA